MASSIDPRLAIHLKLKQDIYNYVDTDSQEYENFVHWMTLSGAGKGLLKQKRNLYDKFDALENIGLLGINNYDFLIKIATSSGNERILDFIKQAKDDLLQLDRHAMQTDTVTSAVQDTKNALVCLYQNYCQRIPIYPLIPSRKRKIEQLYVKPNMKVVDPCGHHAKHSKGFQERKVDKIQDIFYSEGTLCKEIYIEGDMGMGKSSLCEHLVYLWVRSQTGQRPLLEDESFMSSFTLLFYISLKEANETFKHRHRIEDMIKHQLQLTDVDVAKLMSEYSCLILLDGLDELTRETETEVSRFGSKRIPERSLRDDKCVYMTTSRPFKLEHLTRELEGKVNQLISIVGLEMASQRELATNVINMLKSENECNDDRSPDIFFQDIRMHRMSKYLETPVLFMLMLCMWSKGKPLGESECDMYCNMIEMQIELAQEIRDLSMEEHPNYGDQVQLPMRLAKLPNCKRYTYLLSKVSKYAYERLFDKNPMVKHAQNKISEMKEEELNLLLQMGILTQRKVFGGLTDELKSVSFIHQGHQEFLCAMHLITEGKQSSLSELLSEFISDVYSMHIDKHYSSCVA